MKFLRTSDRYVFHKLGNRKIINYLIICLIVPYILTLIGLHEINP